MFKRILAIASVFVLLIAAPCWSAVEVQDDGTVVGLANSINFTGSTVTLSASVASVVLNDIDSGTIDGAVIGGTTPAAGTFTTLTVNTSLTLGGSTITDWGSVVSPWTDGGVTTTLNSAPTKFILTHGSGELFCTVLDTDNITGTTNNQTIDLSTNTKVIFGDADVADTFAIEFDGTDTILESSDGAIVLYSNQADGEVHFKTAQDTNDYLIIDTASDIVQIKTAAGGGDGDLSITADGGEIDFDDENLSTTGTASFGATTVTSLIGVTSFTLNDSDVLSNTVDDVLRWASNDSHSTIEAYGFENMDARLLLSADEGDDDGDAWMIESCKDTNSLITYNDTSGALVAKMTISTLGDVVLGGDVLTFANGEYISNVTDGTVLIATNTEDMILRAYSANAADGDSTLSLQGDAAGAIHGRWDMICDTGADALIWKSDSAVIGTMVTKMTLASATGNLDIEGDLDITGNDITCPTDLLITPGGTEVHIAGGLHVGGTDNVGDNNFKVDGTTALVGAVTITGDVSAADATFTGGDLTMTSATVDKPLVTLEDTHADATPAVIKFAKNSATPADDDHLGRIGFYSDDSGAAASEFAYILAQAQDITAAAEAGSLEFSMEVADTDTSFLMLQAEPAASSGSIDFNMDAADIDFIYDGNTTPGMFTMDATVESVLFQSSITLMPAVSITNTNADANSASLNFRKDGNAEVDGDVIALINFYGNDSADNDQIFGYIKVACTEVDTTDEAGLIAFNLEVNDADTEFLTMSGDTGDVDTGVIEFNSGEIDIDFNLNSLDQADIFKVTAGSNDVMVTRDLALGNTDAALLQLLNDNAGDDQGVLSVIQDAGASATIAAVVVQSSAAATVKSSLYVNHDGTAGATGEAAVVIESEDVKTAALYITAPVDATGTTQEIDDYVLAVGVEGIGGGIIAYRNQAAATEAMLTIEDDNTDATGPLVVFTTDQDADAAVAAIQMITTSAAMDTALLSVTQAGSGAAIDIVSGALAINGDSITCDGVLVIDATSATSFNDENITNVGDIACDSITSDATTVVLINDGLQGLVDEITATSEGVAASLTTVITEITTNGDGDLDNVTLANGVSGQIKVFVIVAETVGGDTVKITPATYLVGTQITFDGTVGDGCVMIYCDNEGWVVVGNNGGTEA